MKEKIFCKICNQQTDFVIDSFSRYHLKKYHPEINGMSEYYKKYIKKDDEGFCLECGKETKFLSYTKGYQKFCSVKCKKKSKYMKDKISESCKNRDYEEVKKKFNKTCQEKYGVYGYTQTEDWKNKYKETCLKNNGVEHNFLMKSCIKKRKKVLNDNKDVINLKRKEFWKTADIDDINYKRLKTVQNKYGVNNVMQLDVMVKKIRDVNEKNNYWIPLHEKTEFEKYHMDVMKYTKRNGIRLLRLVENELYDYYTGEKLVSNYNYSLKYPNKRLSTNPLQPTIDHKISIYYGFQNNIDPKEIGSFENLCICSRSTNSKKGCLTEKEFKRLLKC